MKSLFNSTGITFAFILLWSMIGLVTGDRYWFAAILVYAVMGFLEPIARRRFMNKEW